MSKDDKKRKLIDLSEEVVRKLTIRAAREGKLIKTFIEDHLGELVKNDE